MVALRLRLPYHVRYEPRRKAILQTRPYVRRIGQCGGSHCILHVPTALWAGKRQRGMASRRLTPFWSTGLLPRTPITLIVMGLVVAPCTWPLRRLLVRHRHASTVLLGISGWLLGKAISVQWLRDGAPSMPYDPDGYAGPIFGLMCCATWAIMMPATSCGLSTETGLEKG